MLGGGGSLTSGGERVSKTAVWKSLRGISVGALGSFVAHKGQWSVGGRNVRSCRTVEYVTHSPVLASRRRSFTRAPRGPRRTRREIAAARRGSRPSPDQGRGTGPSPT